MFRVSRQYMVALNQVPGNKKKHFSYIDSSKIYDDFIEWVGVCVCVHWGEVEVIYNDFLDTGYGDEYVILLRKKI